MTRDELIEKEAEKYSIEAWGEHYDTVQGDCSDFSNGEISITDYKNAINSQLAKDLQELAVIDGKIELLKEIGLPNHCSDDEEKIKQFETKRTELLTKLNLEV